MSTQVGPKYEFLLVEDNPGDIRLAHEAFAEVDVKHNK